MTTSIAPAAEPGTARPIRVALAACALAVAAVWLPAAFWQAVNPTWTADNESAVGLTREVLITAYLALSAAAALLAARCGLFPASRPG